MFFDLDIMHTTLLTESEITMLVCEIYKTIKRFFPENVEEIKRDIFLCVLSDACPKSIILDVQHLQTFMSQQQYDKLDHVSWVNDIEEGEQVMEIFQEDGWQIRDSKTQLRKSFVCSCNTIFQLPDGRSFRNTNRVNGKLKHGIHVIFPHIIVDQEHALYIREALIAALSERFGTWFATDGWSEVVDNAVYVSSGLRMIYSQKTKNCDECKKRKSDDNSCPNEKCVNGRIIEGRPYKFLFAMDKGERNEEKTNYYNSHLPALLAHSVLFTKQTEKDPLCKRFEGCPSFGDSIVTSKHANRPPKLKSKQAVYDEEKKSTRSWKSKTAVTDPLILENMQTQIRTRFVKQYKNIRVKSIVKDEKKYYITVDGEGSNYCLNYNNDHNSNRIWFSVEADGIRAHCFCRCLKKDKRNFGFCKDFRSTPRLLSKADINSMFPNKAQAFLSNNPLFANPAPIIAIMNNAAGAESTSAAKRQRR